MRLDLCQPLLPGTCGTVSLSYQNKPFELGVRVAHMGTAHQGMEFIYKSDGERDSVAHLVASLAASAVRPRLVPLN